MRAFASRRCITGFFRSVRNDELSRFAADRLGATFDETDDGVEHIGRCIEIATMDAHLRAAKADHHARVPGERQRRYGFQAASAKKLEEGGFYFRTRTIDGLGTKRRGLRRTRKNIELRGIV